MKLRLLLGIFAMFLISSQVSAIEIMVPDTNDTGFFEKSSVPAKMIAAKHEFNDKNMRGALLIYREVLQLEPDNANAKYWTARCYYGVKRYDLARKYLDEAIELNPKVQDNIDFFYGQIHHRLAELDEAIARYNSFIEKNQSLLGESFEMEEAKRFVAQCKYAKEMMSNPAKVEITNMGPGVNSRFDEYAPSITANGDLLLFTSRRSDAVGGEIDEGGDYKFFEDVYSTQMNDAGEWSKARGVEGDVNTDTYDAVLSVSPDGSQMFVYRNNQNSAGDIFVSGYNSHSEEWRAPEKMPRPINTSYFESSVSITADGSTLYFISERPEGNGQGDIYVSTRSAGGGWGKPRNLGEVVNTELDEKFVFIHPNGKTLYFASNGHQTMGSYDIFRTEFVNGEWSIPVNLGYPINTVNEESTFSMTRDNKTLYIAAEYEDALGERDIYSVDISEYKLLSSGYDKSNYGTMILTIQDANGEELKGAEVNFYIGESGDRVIASEKSDKLGLVRVNLPGAVTYRAEISFKKSMQTINFKMELSDAGETVLKETVQMK